MSGVVALHAATTWFMVGLIWVVQVVHYPLFRLVGRDGFASYEAGHTRRMGLVLALPALTEVVTAAWLFAAPPAGVERGLAFGGGALLAAIWVMTALVPARLHHRLAAGFAPEVHARLVASNWFRTVGWTSRGVIALAFLW